MVCEIPQHHGQLLENILSDDPKMASICRVLHDVELSNVVERLSTDKGLSLALLDRCRPVTRCIYTLFPFIPLFLQKPKSVLNRKTKGTSIQEDAAKLFRLHRENSDLDIQIVPVSILWGRAPGKDTSGWTDVIANQVSPSWLRKFFIVLFLKNSNNSHE